MRFCLLMIAVVSPALLSGQTSVVALADSAINSGQPWRASAMLAPIVASTDGGRTPEAVLTAARAAAGWRGWATVRTLLSKEVWLDLRFDRLGRRLLAEAALGEQQLQQALVHASAAMATTDGRRDRNEQARRYLILARVQDRLDMLDSAAANYRRAAVLLPDVTDWLLLRAAGVTSDSGDRAEIYSRITVPAAKPRVIWTEALAYDRIGDFNTSAERYTRLGAPVTALKVRLKGATTDQAKRSLTTALLALLTPQLSTTESREVVDLIASLNPTLNRDEQLLVARRANTASRAEQVVAFYAAAARTAPLTQSDQLNYANALGTLRRWPEAAKQYRGITQASLAGQAAYYNARALLRADEEPAAIAALQEVILRFPNDTFAAGTAIYLLGDLAIDAGRPDSARKLFRLLTERFPTSSFRSRALIAAAIVAFENGEPAQAAAELKAGLENNPPGALEQDAYRYWMGRAQWVAGDTALARATFRGILAKGPENYYALKAARQLDTLPWSVPPGITPVVPKSLESAFNRAALLESLNMDVEARFELDRIAADGSGAAGLLQVAQAFAAAGYPTRAQQVALRAQAAGAPRDGTLLRLLYPLPYAQLLIENATHEKVDPFLVASVIRQESNFDPRAVSPANARGLMQVLPSLGEELAQGRIAGAFDVAMLFIPDVNLSFGTGHFALALTKYPEIERALAAYNAGPTPVDRWSQTLLGGPRSAADAVRTPLPDVEMFVERIPYVETRDYVRNIMRNVNMYRMLYRE